MQEHGSSSKELSSKMAKLSISEETEFFPFRPGFGTGGTEVLLWANYFKLNVSADTLFAYHLHVLDKKTTKAEQEAGEEAGGEAEQEAAGKKKGKKGKKEKPSEQKTDDDQKKAPREAKGKKLAKLIELALKKLPATLAVATEYKSQLISLKPLELPPDNIMDVNFSEPGRDDETWFIRFDGPRTMDIRGLKEYLKTGSDPSNDNVFPKFPEEVDALGVVMGHTARSSVKTSAVGRSRFYAIDQERKESSGDLSERALLEILRGYFQSVRPATGRLLLNVNVTHGVFRKPIRLEDLFRMRNLTNLDQPDKISREQRAELDRLHRFLARSRIQYRIPGDKPGEEFVIERGMAGLATVKDGKDEERKPVFRYTNFPYASPATTQFFLSEPKKTPRPPPPGLQYNQMVTVAKYIQASKDSFPQHRGVARIFSR